MRCVWGLRESSHFMAQWNTKPDTNGNQKEQRGLDQHAADADALTGAGTQHTGQHDNADDIINDGSADNGSAKEAL